jgi:uncharacterized protein involved in response to NO
MAESHQYPFTLVIPAMRLALALGALGGFVLAAVITLARAFRISLGIAEPALIQAHGHVQIMGWVGLFMLAVATHVIPRLRGQPLAFAGAVPWVWRGLAVGLTLRLVSQPLAATGVGIWRAGMVASGLLELASLWTLGVIFLATVTRGPSLRGRPAMLGILPLLIIALVGLMLGPVVTLVGLAQASASVYPLLPSNLDEMTVALGLMGFLVPLALAMSVRFLPLYGGLRPFPRTPLVIFEALYALGLVTLPLALTNVWLAGFGLGHLLLGLALTGFAGTMGWLIVRRPPPVVSAKIPMSPAPPRARPATSGVFAMAGLTALAFFWLLFGGIIFVTDGIAMLAGGALPIPLDAARHSLALGFIGLLLCGIAPRLAPAFSGHAMRSHALVTATFWVGLGASVTRVGSVLLQTSAAGASVALLGASGVLGLSLAWLLLLNLWPALPLPRRA